MVSSSPKWLFPFIAPPNAGKGTQTQILSERYNLPVFDMGATFRSILKEGRDPQLKHKLETYMNQGQLVPVETVLEVFTKGFDDLVKKNPKAEGFILDGFPRNKDQAAALLKLCGLGKLHTPYWMCAFYLKVSNEVVKARATGRRFCSLNARHVYNINDPALKPKTAKMKTDQSTVETDSQGRQIFQCDIDGADLIIRADDEPQTVEKRLTEYYQETEPLIQFFRTEKGLGQSDTDSALEEIVGEQRPEQVTEAIQQKIEKCLTQRRSVLA